MAEGWNGWVLKPEADPLRLEQFFPNAKPVWSISTNNTLEPVPEYLEYEDQALELDDLTERIDKLTDAGNLENLASLWHDPRHQFVRGDIGDEALVRRLLAEHKPRAILMTGDPDSFYRANTTSLDIFAVLEKPVPMRTLSRFILKALS